MKRLTLCILLTLFAVNAHALTSIWLGTPEATSGSAYRVPVYISNPEARHYKFTSAQVVIRTWDGAFNQRTGTEAHEVGLFPQTFIPLSDGQWDWANTFSFYASPDVGTYTVRMSAEEIVCDQNEGEADPPILFYVDIATSYGTGTIELVSAEMSGWQALGEYPCPEDEWVDSNMFIEADTIYLEPENLTTSIEGAAPSKPTAQKLAPSNVKTTWARIKALYR
jgi:hypothetical protein